MIDQDHQNWHSRQIRAIRTRIWVRRPGESDIYYIITRVASQNIVNEKWLGLTAPSPSNRFSNDT